MMLTDQQHPEANATTCRKREKKTDPDGSLQDPREAKQKDQQRRGPKAQGGAEQKVPPKRHRTWPEKRHECKADEYPRHHDDGGGEAVQNHAKQGVPGNDADPQ